MANMQNILNVIRANASQEYQSRIPEATRDNLADVGNPILTYQTTQNEFLNQLIGRIALTVVHNKIAKNPLALLKKGSIPLGSDIQEIFTNMAKDQGFDGKGDKLLKRTIPDVKTLYHRRNRQSQYPVTVSKQQLTTAFTSYAELEKLLSGIVTSMYSGDNYDEFILMKNLMSDAVKLDKVVQVDVPHITSEGATTTFVKAVKNISSAMTFPNTQFNRYYDNRPDTDKGDPITTWTPVEDQVFICRADVLNEIDVDVLAKAFNLDKVSFLAKTIPVDNFGEGTNIMGMLIDKSWVQVYENLFETSEFYNSQGLYWNYWLNHWQTYSFSYFANAVAFVCNDESISLDKTTATITTIESPLTLTATTTPNDAPVTWVSSDKKVATVSESGVVTAVKSGKCVITAINGDKVANCVVTVNLA